MINFTRYDSDGSLSGLTVIGINRRTQINYELFHLVTSSINKEIISIVLYYVRTFKF